MVRLIFIMEKVLKNGCRAERMWVEITKIDRDDFYGILTNQPCYIKGLNIGDTINFHTSNIATVLLKEKPTFNEDYFAIITKRALESEEINWLIRTNDLHDEKDSGWQLFYGDEDDAYLDKTENAAIITLGEALSFEPLLENVFKDNGSAYFYSKEKNQFILDKNWIYKE